MAAEAKAMRQSLKRSADSAELDEAGAAASDAGDAPVINVDSDDDADEGPAAAPSAAPPQVSDETIARVYATHKATQRIEEEAPGKFMLDRGQALLSLTRSSCTLSIHCVQTKERSHKSGQYGLFGTRDMCWAYY